MAGQHGRERKRKAKQGPVEKNAECFAPAAGWNAGYPPGCLSSVLLCRWRKRSLCWRGASAFESIRAIRRTYWSLGTKRGVSNSNGASTLHVRMSEAAARRGNFSLLRAQVSGGEHSSSFPSFFLLQLLLRAWFYLGGRPGDSHWIVCIEFSGSQGLGPSRPSLGFAHAHRGRAGKGRHSLGKDPKVLGDEAWRGLSGETAWTWHSWPGGGVV